MFYFFIKNILKRYDFSWVTSQLVCITMGVGNEMGLRQNEIAGCREGSERELKRANNAM